MRGTMRGSDMASGEGRSPEGDCYILGEHVGKINLIAK